MNKLKNRFLAVLIVTIGTLCLYSCSDSFLDETDTRRETSLYFDTPEGMRALIAGLPVAFRLHTTTESMSYGLVNYGTDEFTVGSDAANQPWNDYSVNLQAQVTSSSNTIQPNEVWQASYIFLNTINTVLTRAPEVLATDPDLARMMAEARFIRGWIYFELVQQWGDVPLLTEPTIGVQREFPRAPKAEVLTAIIDDFKAAYQTLDNPAGYGNTDKRGRIYKDAAAHYLAKVLVYRQSEINGDVFASTKDADLTEALRLCREVVANRPLAPNFMDLWNYTTPDGAEEALPEILLAAQYSHANNSANSGAENMISCFFISVYDKWPGMLRNVEGGRPYARLRTTDFAMDVYDRVNDSRFWKSFRTAQTVNGGTEGNGFTNGQAGIIFIINNESDASRFMLPGSTATMPLSSSAPPMLRMTTDGGATYEPITSMFLGLPDDPAPTALIPNVLPRYRVVEGLPTASPYAYPTTSVGSFFPSLSKYNDGLIVSLNSPGHQRDIIKARVAETYLLGAEILIRQEQYATAFTEFINPLRARAQYKVDEDRAEQKHGGQAYTGTNPPTSFSPVNTYYLSNNIPVTTAASDLQVTYPNYPAADQAIMDRLSYTSEYDKAMCFLLNERSRELMGEMLRWHDLARTKTLIDRAYAFNDGVRTSNSLAEHHYLRPIPLPYLEGVFEDGLPLTPIQRKAYQNPGYN